MQALWLNALWIAVRLGTTSAARWQEMLDRGRASFAARFWNEGEGALHDVVDVDHQPGTVDPTFRPNQILAVGGLPLALLEGDRARRMVDAVEARLYTPYGLRSLAPDHPGYHPHYAGDMRERDSGYHQGAAWLWLLGPVCRSLGAGAGRGRGGPAPRGGVSCAAARALGHEAGLGHSA